MNLLILSIGRQLTLAFALVIGVFLVAGCNQEESHRSLMAG